MRTTHKTMKEYIDDSYGKVKLKRGRYFIIQGHPGRGISDPEIEHELWHQCSKESWEDLAVVSYSCFSEYAAKPIIPKWRCEICKASPPDSIVAVWALLEPDATSEEVQETLKEEEEQKRFELEKDDPMWLKDAYATSQWDWLDDT